MKRTKKLLILCGVLVVAGAATLALNGYEERQEEIQNSEAVILEIPTDTVESISWEYDGAELAFHKEEEKWLYDEDAAFPVSEEKIEKILSNFESFGVHFVIENVEDYSQYGLEDARGSLKISAAGENYEVKLGDFSKMDEQRYIDIGDGNVYLVSSDPADYLETELSAMILHDEIPELERVSKIAYEGAENYSIVYKHESSTYSEEDLCYVEENGEFLPLDSELVETYLSTISSLQLTTYKSYDATEEELAECGLAEPELSVTVNHTYTDEEENEIADSVILHIGRNPEDVKAAEEAEAQEEDLPEVAKYLRVGDSQIIYELDDSTYETLIAASYDDLRHKEVIWADLLQMTQLEITLEGKTHILTSVEEDDARLWYYGEEEIEIYSLKNALYGLTAESFTEETADNQEEIRLTVYLEHEKFPQVEITLYRYDGTYCLAAVDGASVSLVERSLVMELVEAVQAIVLN